MVMLPDKARSEPLWSWLWGLRWKVTPSEAIEAKFEWKLQEATPEKGLKVSRERPRLILLAARTMLTQGSR